LKTKKIIIYLLKISFTWYIDKFNTFELRGEDLENGFKSSLAKANE
jgi:hypothetical protein